MFFQKGKFNDIIAIDRAINEAKQNDLEGINLVRRNPITIFRPLTKMDHSLDKCV
jgi:hypothetical protein